MTFCAFEPQARIGHVLLLLQAGRRGQGERKGARPWPWGWVGMDLPETTEGRSVTHTLAMSEPPERHFQALPQCVASFFKPLQCNSNSLPRWVFCGQGAYRFAKAMVRHPVSHDDPPGWEPLNGTLRAASFPPRALVDPWHGLQEEGSGTLLQSLGERGRVVGRQPTENGFYCTVPGV